MYCGIHMTPAAPCKRTSMTLEHIIPKSVHVKGQRNHYGLACRICNNVRGTLMQQGIIEMTQADGEVNGG